MALGSAIFFYPYKFKEDLTRYRYAKQRWILREKMPPSSWTFKMQHDLLQQAYANSVILATPFLLQVISYGAVEVVAIEIPLILS